MHKLPLQLPQSEKHTNHRNSGRDGAKHSPRAGRDIRLPSLTFVTVCRRTAHLVLVYVSK